MAEQVRIEKSSCAVRRCGSRILKFGDGLFQQPHLLIRDSRVVMGVVISLIRCFRILEPEFRSYFAYPERIPGDFFFFYFRRLDDWVTRDFRPGAP